MHSIDQLCDTVNPTGGQIVADGVIHPADWDRDRRGVIFAGRVIRMQTGIETLQCGGGIRSLPRNWRQVTRDQGQQWTEVK